MKRVLVIDTNQGFTSDLERNLIINELEDIEIFAKNNIDEALNELDSINPDEVVIPVALISVGSWDLDIPVITYAHSNDEILESHNNNFKCYGIIKRANDLLDVIEKGIPLHIETSNANENNDVSEPEPSKNILTTNGFPQSVQSQTKKKQKKVPNENSYGKEVDNSEGNNADSNKKQNQSEKMNHDAAIPSQQNNQAEYYQNGPQMQQPYENPYGNNMQTPSGLPNMHNPQGYYQGGVQGQQPYPYGNQYGNNMQNGAQQQNFVNPNYQGNNYPQQDNYNQGNPYPNMGNRANEGYPQSQQNINYQNNMQVNGNMSVQEGNVAKNMRQRAAEREINAEHNAMRMNNTLAENQFNNDMGYTKKTAKCITVFAAKGGVGKTTISCELATFLALTSHGRNKFKVCIADFNIDFGDVLNTLSFDANGSNMTTWAADIKERIAGGEDPRSIQYPEARIRTWLQKNEKDGLYALLAPISNADSMDIDDKCIEVMLDNLIHNCDFDFVICDTGNNTRDASFIALEKADEVFLVLNQSVNTANCNNSFLATAQRVGFNMNKIRLIINKVIPAKVAGISTDELESAFRNPYTGKPYECIAKIKNNNDIINSGNLGAPLTYNSSHEFTRSIGEIVQYITGGQTVLKKQEKKKKGFFNFLSKDK